MDGRSRSMKRNQNEVSIEYVKIYMKKTQYLREGGMQKKEGWKEEEGLKK
jgi:hypothetical protein